MSVKAIQVVDEFQAQEFFVPGEINPRQFYEVGAVVPAGATVLGSVEPVQVIRYEGESIPRFRRPEHQGFHIHPGRMNRSYGS